MIEEAGTDVVFEIKALFLYNPSGNSANLFEII